MKNFFEKKFMDEMEKKSSTTTLLLYGVTEPVTREKDDLKKHLEKICDVGVVTIDEMDRYLYAVAAQSGEILTLNIETEAGFYDMTVDKMCRMAEIYTLTDLNYIRSTFSVDKNSLYGYDTTHDIRESMQWSLKKLVYILLGIFEESR